MHLKKIRPYLTGELFHSPLNVDLPQKKFPKMERDSFLRKTLSGKKVLHVGYVAQKNLPERIAKGSWLHGQLLEVTERCMGVDINCEGVEWLRNEHDIGDAVCIDVEKDHCQEIADGQWDYALLGEVLEHVHNPVSFLKSFKRYDSIKRVLVTVPNLLNIKNYQLMFDYKESINSDHRFSFTPFNLCKTLTTAGFHVEDINFCVLTKNLPAPVKWKHSLDKRIGKGDGYPFYAFEKLVVTAANGITSE